MVGNKRTFMESYNVIATPNLQYNDPNFGEAKILFYYDSTSEKFVPKVPSNDIFQSKYVWITSGYDQYIQDKYAQGEIFLLKDIQRTRQLSSEQTSSRNHHDWCGRGSNAERLTSRIIPILEINLPDIDSGIIGTPPMGIRRGLHFIENGGFIYGPFDITINDGVVIATPSRPAAVSGTNDHVTKCEVKSLVDMGLVCQSEISFGGARRFITSLKDYGVEARSLWTEIDYISAKRIFKQLVKVRSRENNFLITKKELARLEQNVEKFMRDRNSHQNGQKRLERALNLLHDMQGTDIWFEVVNSYVNSIDGKKALVDFKVLSTSSEHKGEYESLNSDLDRLKNQILKAETELEDKNQQLVDTEKRIRLEGTKNNQILERKNEELRLEKKILLDDIEKVKQESVILKDKYKDFKELSSLEEAINKAREINRDLEGTKRTMETAVKEQKELLATPERLAAELTSVHTVMQSLGYSQFPSPAASEDPSFIYHPQAPASLDSEVRAADLLVTIADRMNSSGGKSLSTVEVGNLLICAQQHILVVLKGRPGVGKTSTVIKLAEALGIKSGSAIDADFLNVPVARGWSSSRDLLGYYNSLRGEFQPAKTGVYQFLRNGESDRAVNARMILLDEANLSPIEHYWSDFIGLCDSEGADRAITTGSFKDGEATLRPNMRNNLRFFATINSDATVEPLSDRLLDRAPVICMDASDENEINGELLSFDGAITNQLLEDLFGRKSFSEIDVNNSIEKIQEFIKQGVELAPQLRDCLYIEGRRKIHIEQYLNCASNVFEDETIARDFAVAQFVLPHLRCDGNGMEEAIGKLMIFCNDHNWERSEDILSGILKRGDKYLQHYSFL